MNRIREIRKQKNISQAKIAEFLNTTPQSISLYEKGQREPKITTWQKLAEFFEVPTPYLMGVSDDPDGFDLWKNATGYDQKQIQNEIERMKRANRVSSDETLQHLIGRAVTNLDGDMGGETDASALHEIQYLLKNIRNEVLDKYYLDPKKVDQLPKIGNVPIFNPGSKHSDGSLFYDDMDPVIYHKIDDILHEAINKIQDLR